MEVLKLAGLVFWKQMSLCMYTRKAFSNFRGASTQRMTEIATSVCIFFKKKIGLVNSWTNIIFFLIYKQGQMAFKNFLCLLARNFIIFPCFLGKQDPGHSGESRAHTYLLKYQKTPTKELEITGKKKERLFPSFFYDFAAKGELKSLEKDTVLLMMLTLSQLFCHILFS